MKHFIALCLLLVCRYSASIVNANSDELWNSFKSQHKKNYASLKEDGIRRSNWQANQKKIDEHNAGADAGQHSYRLAMNRFGDITTDEFNKEMKGFNSSSKIQRRAVNHIIRTATLSSSIDWRKYGYVTPVKNQGLCGACWTFSTTGALEGQHYAKTKKLVSLSEQNLIDCSTFRNSGCDGGNMDNAFRYIKSNNGIDTESSYPYQAVDGKCQYNPSNVGATITGFVDIQSKSENALQDAIAAVGPIAVAIDASHSSFRFYSSGVYNEPACSSTSLDHAVLAVGYSGQGNQAYYIVKNSWGTSWGQSGYIFMSRNKNNQCGIATAASYPLV